MAALKIGLGLGGWRPPGTAPASETNALVARMSVSPGVARVATIDRLVRALLAGGVWSRLAGLYVLAAHDAQAARLNWVGSGFPLVPVNSPAFTVDRGYAGDGATSYLDSGFVTGTEAGFSRSDAFMGVWTGTEASGATLCDIGTDRSRINALSGGNPQVRGNASSTDAVTPGVASAIGWTWWSRSASGSFEAGRGGGAGVSITRSSVLLQSAPILIGAVAPAAGMAQDFSPRRVQAAAWGLSLTVEQRAGLHAALAAYMTEIGA